jgi:hypothetical protein
MSDTYLADRLDELVTADPPPAWDDVLGRARRSRRRYSVAAVALATLVFVPATWAVASSFEGSPPPQPINDLVQKWDTTLAPQLVAMTKKWASQPEIETADLSKMHGVLQVRTPYGLYDLWAAPGSNGGVCAFEAFSTDLQAGGDGNVDGGCWNPPLRLYVGGLTSPSSHPDLGIADGYTSIPHAATATVTLTDGRSATSPVVEGFYVTTFEQQPGEQRLATEGGPTIATTTIADANGNELSSADGP